MTIENVTPIITSSVGGFFIGIILGYFAKIIKILMFIAGGLIALALYLQQQQIISVNTDKLEDSSAFIINSMASSFDMMTQFGDTSSIGIPLTASLAAGFTLGLMRS